MSDIEPYQEPDDDEPEWAGDPKHMGFLEHLEELRRRIETDEVEQQAREWRLEHVVAFERARGWLARSADVVVDTTDCGPEAVAQLVIEATNEALRAGR